jgi:hypothetical protein
MGIHFSPDTSRYARCVENSKRVRWDIEDDVIRGRRFDFNQKFLPDGLSRIDEFPVANAQEARFISQIQGRTYANMFGLAERFINAKILEVSQEHWMGDQIALEALVRFSDEELKHQALFRRIEELVAAGMPAGYRFTAEPNAVAQSVLSASTWAVLGLTLNIELFTQVHYKESIAEDSELSELYRDVFRFHWMEEAQHAVLDELEWKREDARLDAVQRDNAVNDLIGLVVAVDGILQEQAKADSEYFVRHCNRALSRVDIARLHTGFLSSYRWQFILSGVQVQRFSDVLTSLVTDEQMQRIENALLALAVTPAPLEGGV